VNRSASPARERGVALIAALLVVALAVVLIAALLDTGESTRARSRNSLRGEQTWQLLHGLEGWAASALLRDAQDGAIDSPGEFWAQPMPPLPIPGGQVHGRLRELGGCFDLNRLVRRDGGSAEVDVIARQRFERLLAVLRLDPAIAAQAVDWLDDDVLPTVGGAEDPAYLRRRPGYRTANRAFAHRSELRLLDGVDAAAFDRLAPHVCVLPRPVPMNLNFASPALWMSLDDRITEAIARRLSAEGQARHPSLAAVQQQLEALVPGLVLDALEFGVESRYFVAEAEIMVDGIPYAYASLLQRSDDQVRVLQRVRGRL
jgi:general secretion pathway protein K